MNNKVAIVTDLKVIDSPQAGLGVAHCLKDAGFSVIGIDDTPFVTSNPNLFLKTFCWEEIRNLNFDSLIKKIIDIKKIYGLDYIFPCYDETAVLFSFIKDKLDYLKIKLISPSISTLKLIRKNNLHNLVNDLKNYKTPATTLVNSLDEALKFAKLIGYPVFCKGVTKSALFCKDEESLRQNIKKISDIWNNGQINCLIQKYITGKYKNCIVAIKNNRIIDYVEMTKIGIDQNGATWFGKVEKTKELLDLTNQLVNSLSFDSCIIEMETIKDDKGDYYLYEINPRSPAWIYAPCQLGLNLPKVTIQNITSGIKFIEEEGYFGREMVDFIRKDVENFNGNLNFYSKGAAYKNGSLKYPSDLL